MASNQQWIELAGPALFPAGCFLAVQRYDAPEILLPEVEDASLGRATEKRQREFSAGRVAARAALRRLGIAETLLPVGTNRSPRWPGGVVGSITHTAGLAVAVVARQENITGLGLDLELNAAVKQELWRGILTARELAWISGQPRDRQEPLATLIFSAKESFYKLQYPLTGRWVDFLEADITFLPEAGEFQLTCTQSEATMKLQQSRFHGRFAISTEFTLTAMHLAGAAQ